jgi:hypothetical protein
LSFLLGVFGVTWLGIAEASFTKLRRIAANPHVEGRIERTWITSGKHGARYADVSFVSSGPDGPIACRVGKLRIGGKWSEASPGESLSLAPIPGSCATPDLPGEAPPAILVAVAAGIGVLACYGALKLLAGSGFRLRATTQSVSK